MPAPMLAAWPIGAPPRAAPAAAPGRRSHATIPLRAPLRTRPPRELRLAASSNDIQPPEGGGDLGNAALPRPLLLRAKSALSLVLGGASLAVLGGVAAAPSLMSQPRVLAAATRAASERIPGRLEVDRVDLGWTKPVLARGVRLFTVDEDGKDIGEPVFKVDHVRTTAPLWKVAFNDAGLAGLHIEGPSADLSARGPAATPALLTALPPPPPGAPALPAVSTGSKSMTFTAHAMEMGFPPLATRPEEGIPPFEAFITQGSLKVPPEVQAALGTALHVEAKVGVGEGRPHPDTSLAKSKALPLELTVKSPTSHLRAKGAVDLGSGQVVLAAPVTAELEISSSLSRHMLKQVNPLLVDVAEVKQRPGGFKAPLGAAVITPEGMVLPAPSYQIAIHPMRVTLGEGQLLSGILDLLRVRPAGGPGGRVAARTSEIRARVSDGAVRTERMDVLISVDKEGREGVHVAMWGRTDQAGHLMRWTLGIPGDTIEWCLGLPEGSLGGPGFMLQLAVGGSPDNPQVDWRSAVRDVAALALRAGGQRAKGSRFGAAMSMAGEFMIDQHRGGQGAHTVPPQPPLPWEEEIAAREATARASAEIHQREAEEAERRKNAPPGEDGEGGPPIDFLGYVGVSGLGGGCEESTSKDSL